MALKRAIATFSNSQEASFLDYLKRILLENQILLGGSRVKITHSKFPISMTQKQLQAARERIQDEIRLYVPDAEVNLYGFPCLLRAL
jgi:hypothetical protein